jgi:hypothetical protein
MADKINLYHQVNLPGVLETAPWGFESPQRQSRNAFTPWQSMRVAPFHGKRGVQTFG